MERLCHSSLASNSSNWLIQQEKSTAWSKEENKQFESALAIYDEKTPNRWFNVAAMIPGKSVYDVINQYRELVADVSDIEAGLVPIPGYLGTSLELEDHQGFDMCRKRGRSCHRKKGVPWTEEEHRRFLLGLEKHGKGDWRSISRNFVKTKTPIQVASHAQKYYLRQISGGKDKRRPSIHDITTNDLANATSLLNNNKAPLLEKPIINNDGALMVLDSTFDIDYPRSTATHGRYIVNVVGSTPGVYVQSSRFLGSEHMLRH